MTKTFTVTPKLKQQEMNKKCGELFKNRKKHLWSSVFIY